MNCKVVVVAVLLTLASVNVHAQDGLGLGVIVGEPTGLSLKYWLSDERAFDAAAAWSFSENDSFQIHTDYLIHNFDLIDPVELSGRLPVYYGVGGRLKLKNDNDGKGRNDDDALFGIRFPLGITYLFADAPLDFFAEVVPILDIAPDTDIDINAAIGVRLYFR